MQKDAGEGEGFMYMSCYCTAGNVGDNKIWWLDPKWTL